MKYINLSLFLLFFGFSCFSQTSGCASATSNYIYVDRDGTVNNVPNYKFDEASDRYLQITNVYCIKYSAQNTCYITVPTNSPAYNNAPYFRSNYGTYVTFSLIQCSLDDYLSWLTFPVAIFMFFLIKRRVFF